MKTIKIWMYTLILIGFALVLTYSCKKETTTTPSLTPVINMYPLYPAIIFNSNLNYDSTKDIDGNVYKTIKIGTQTWMAENLKTTKYNDSTSIPEITNNATWNALTTGAYCWSNNDIKFKPIFGALYNWYTVNTGKLCPIGWHVSSETEWETLISFLGGDSLAGGKLKETGFSHWNSPNTGANNETGFTALPGGDRGIYGYFGSSGRWGEWWTSVSKIYWMWNDESRVFRYGGVFYTDGYSVRCVKDSI
ncbi:MAG: fibrobacter succinogenes major paralogous domain-containing protein [Bacteroidetes bacterium]|nr:fibrobacter succinogenes major paralogous domain-containing protein [Bacteroidota bacterium]